MNLKCGRTENVAVCGGNEYNDTSVCNNESELWRCCNCRSCIVTHHIPHSEPWPWRATEVSSVFICISEVRILEGSININHSFQAFVKTERLKCTLLICVSEETVMALTSNVSTSLILYAPCIILQYVYKPTRCTKFMWLDFIFQYTLYMFRTVSVHLQ